MNRLTVLIIFLIFSSCSVVENGRGPSSEFTVYNATKEEKVAYFEKKSLEFAKEMLETFPPDDHVIIGWGINTTGTMNAFRKLGVPEAYLWEVPITKLNKIIPNSINPYPVRGSSASGEEMSREEAVAILKKRRERLFKKVLPSPEELNGKKLVFHRSLWSGQTFAEFSSSMIDYMKKNNYPLPLKIKVIVSDSGHADYVFKKAFGVDTYINPNRTGDRAELLEKISEGDDFTFDTLEDGNYKQLIIEEVNDVNYSVPEEELRNNPRYQEEALRRQEKKSGVLSNGKYSPQSAMEILEDTNWTGFTQKNNQTCTSLVGGLLTN
ncbi:MAG: hypothetical protein KC478_12895 [Bacteriovoracaceae bacterium]|nr:hypothetical protein [Bacteriovoracaceae bacterium]